MTWAFSGSDCVQVDFFSIQQPGDEDIDIAEPLIAEEIGFEHMAPLNEESVTVTELRALSRAMAITEQLYESAPEPRDRRTIADRRVRGDWVRADLIAPSDLYLLLGILDGRCPLRRSGRSGANATGHGICKTSGTCRSSCWSAFSSSWPTVVFRHLIGQKSPPLSNDIYQTPLCSVVP